MFANFLHLNAIAPCMEMRTDQVRYSVKDAQIVCRDVAKCATAQFRSHRLMLHNTCQVCTLGSEASASAVAKQ